MRFHRLHWQIGGWVLILLLLAGCSTPTRTATLTPTLVPPHPIVITPEPGTPEPEPVFNLHIVINDKSFRPVKAMIFLEWPDTGGSFSIGPTADYVLPIPVDGAPFVLTVEAEGYHTATQQFQIGLSRDLDYELVILLSPIEIEPKPQQEA